MQPFPLRWLEAGLAVAGAIGLLILIAPTFGRKPEATEDGWRFSVKPTCLMLYGLALGGGFAAVALGASQLLSKGTAFWAGWVGFAFGFLLVPLVLADWPEPLILDGQGLLTSGFAASRIRWQELRHVRAYRVRCDRGLVVQGSSGKQLVVADIAYDSRAFLQCLLRTSPVPYYRLHEEIDSVSLFQDRPTQS